MKILGIETSCDETALSLLDCSGGLIEPHFDILAEVVHSQIEIHKQYGGVFPMMAKREHSKNIVPLFKSLLEKAGCRPSDTSKKFSAETENKLEKILAREPELLKEFSKFIPSISKPPIDAIAVTYGPGLEPALWVGINFATALASVWNIPIIPTNHMEGHIFSVLTTPNIAPKDIRFPLIALLVSGGHTELILVEEWLKYKLIGQTRDDAVGEAFDKVARILGLPYPGGPQISKLAREAREKKLPSVLTLPRPMLKSKDYDFSFSGLKTSVLYQTKKMGPLSADQKASIAREFEDASIDVLVEKTKKALLEFHAASLIIAGGVVANETLRNRFSEMTKALPDTKLFVPLLKHSTDNAVMIAAAGYLRASLQKTGSTQSSPITAKGNVRLHPHIS